MGELCNAQTVEINGIRIGLARYPGDFLPFLFFKTRACVTTTGVGDTTWIRKAACDCHVQDSIGLDMTTTLGYTGVQ